MLNYSTLTKGQKRFINAAISIKPELATATEISRAMLHEVYFALRDTRASGGEKVGYPNWLCNDYKTGRGSYHWAAPTAEQLAADAAVQPKAKAKKNTAATEKARQRLEKIISEPADPDTVISDDEFLAELKEAGIEV